MRACGDFVQAIYNLRNCEKSEKLILAQYLSNIYGFFFLERQDRKTKIAKSVTSLYLVLFLFLC